MDRNAFIVASVPLQDLEAKILDPTFRELPATGDMAATTVCDGWGRC